MSEIVNSSLKFNSLKFISYVHRSYTAPKKNLKLCLSCFSYRQTIHLFCCSSISWSSARWRGSRPFGSSAGETSHGPLLSWTMRQCSWNAWFHTDVTPRLLGLLAMATRPCNSFPVNKPEWQHVQPLWVALCLREMAASHFLLHHEKQTQKT